MHKQSYHISNQTLGQQEHHPNQCPITYPPPTPHNLHQMTTYEEGWMFGCVTLVTRSSKSTSRPCQSYQITRFIPIWGWSISAGPARLHYPQTSCEMAIMCVQACGGNGPLCRPSVLTSQQWASYTVYGWIPCESLYIWIRSNGITSPFW